MSLFIDDMIIISDDINGISVLNIKLAIQFKMNDLGSLWYFLGIEVPWSPKGYLLSRLKYVANILKRTKLTDNKTADTLIEINLKYSSFNDLLLSKPILYRTIIGSLVYFIITRP